MIRKFFVVAAVSAIFGVGLFGNSKLATQCEEKGETFFFAGGECLEFYKADGEIKGALNIIVHGNWPEGSNTLARYAPFADNIAMATDITTVTFALPGYSKSSSNKLQMLAKGGKTPLAITKGYVTFIGDVVATLKKKYDANSVTYIGHSAGAMMGASLVGTKPNLIQNIALAGGKYIFEDIPKSKDLIRPIDVVGGLDKNLQMVLVYGGKDTVSPPKFTVDFYDILKVRGVDVKLIEALDSEHLDLDMTDESVSAITTMLEK